MEKDSNRISITSNSYHRRTGLELNWKVLTQQEPNFSGWNQLDVKLSQNVHSSNSSNAIFPGGSLELEINVANTGDFQQLYFNASDDLNFFRSINPSQRSLEASPSSFSGSSEWRKVWCHEHCHGIRISGLGFYSTREFHGLICYCCFKGE